MKSQGNLVGGAYSGYMCVLVIFSMSLSCLISQNVLDVLNINIFEYISMFIFLLSLSNLD